LIKVILTQRVDFINSYKEIRDSTDQQLSKWLIHAGFLPVPISNKLVIIPSVRDAWSGKQPILENWLITIKPHALLLSGGNDIGENPARDETEKFLLEWAQKNRTPILGICRGMQMMAVWSKGKLIRIKNHSSTRHQLKISNLASDWPSEVNSFHRWGLDGCPADFEVKAFTDDNVIEAIKHKQLPWEGWMWHPEREVHFSKKDTRRLKALFVE
jgi:putative glutamine amidotransferase